MSTVHLTAAYTLLVATVHLYFTLYTVHLYVRLWTMLRAKNVFCTHEKCRHSHTHMSTIVQAS